MQGLKNNIFIHFKISIDLKNLIDVLPIGKITRLY